LAQSKITPLAALSDWVRTDDLVAFGGAWFANHPMAAVRELIRQGSSGIHAMTLLGSIDIDLLVGAGVADRVTFSMVTLEAFGLAPCFRRSVEKQTIQIREVTALALETMVDAAGRNVPFLPMPGPAGSDLVSRHPDLYGWVTSPFEDQQTMVVRALRPDVAIVHAVRADAEGNAQLDGTFGMDVELAKAATRVVVTCETIVDRTEITSQPYMTQIPGFLVDAVIEAPFGAHPTSHVPLYAMDAWEIMSYARAAASAAAPDQLSSYLDQLKAESEEDYRVRVLSGRRPEVLHALGEQGRILDGAIA
jgi:acyl CoA:acetate/3-ketoacid CoA transferase alpha subunit